VSSNIGYTTERCTHCLSKSYGPSEEGNVIIKITSDTILEEPNIPNSKYNEYGSKQKIISSNYCTYV